MKKRWYALFLSLTLTITLLAGCGQEVQPPVETDDDPVVQESILQNETQEESIAPEKPDSGLPAETPNQPSEPEDPDDPVQTQPTEKPASNQKPTAQFSLAEVPVFTGTAYVAINDNKPYFTPDELTAESFESYAPLDSLGRCGVTVASIGRDLMPTEKRGEIGMIRPSGWHPAKYDCVDGKYLYNRCHLIGFQLSGENANTSNLITGTRYLNIEGMLPFENMVADYVKETSNHVMYRATPIFEGNNLVASGVLMEGYSVEDQGAGIEYCIYAYNAQPGVAIDYATGDSWLDGSIQTPVAPEPEPVKPAPTPESDPASEQSESQADYILNTNSKKFHYPSCSSVDDMKETNKQEFYGTRDELISQGYSPCGRCKP